MIELITLLEYALTEMKNASKLSDSDTIKFILKDTIFHMEECLKFFPAELYSQKLLEPHAKGSALGVRPTDRAQGPGKLDAPEGQSSEASSTKRPTP